MDAFPFTIYRGDTVTIDFVVTEDDLPFDLSTSVIKFMGKRDLTDADTDAEFEESCTLTTPLDGECSVELQVDTEGDYIVELEYRKSTTILTLKQWRMTVSKDVREGT